MKGFLFFEKEAEMKKIVQQIKQTMRKAGYLLAGLLGAQPVLDPVPVRVERGYRRK